MKKITLNDYNNYKFDKKNSSDNSYNNERTAFNTETIDDDFITYDGDDTVKYYHVLFSRARVSLDL